MGIANIVNTAGGGGGGSEIITNLVNSVDGAGLRLANQGYISCADVSANRFGTNDFSVEFVLSQETNAANADIFISNLNGSNQAVDAAVIRWDVVQNDNIQLVFTNSSAVETAYNFGYDPAPDLNEPTHYLVSADRSGNAVLYRNGAEIASISIAASGSANVGNSGQPTVIGSPVNNFGVKGNVYRLRTYSKALSSDEAKNVFDRADVPTALVSNLLLDLDCAYANPTQSTVIQDRGPNNQDGTLNGTITQTNVIKQLNSVSARIGTSAATPADGQLLVSGSVEIGSSSAVDTQLSVECDTTGEAIGDGIRIQNAHGVNADIAPVYFGVHGGTRRAKAAIGLKRTGSYGIGELRFAVDSNGDDADVSFANDTKLSISSTGAITTSVTAGSAQALTVTGGNNAVGNICALFRSNDTNSWVNVRNNGQLHTTGGLVFDSQTDASGTGITSGSAILKHYEEGTFTPTDVSGAGLTFTSVSCNYTRIGRVVILTGSFVYPTTSSSAQARVTPGTFPFSATGSTAGTMTIATVAEGGGIDTAGYIRKDDNSIFTNANLSGATINFNTTYIV